MVLATRENPRGERLTTTGDVLGTAASQMAPAPISLGVPIRAAAHAVAPSAVAPPPPGALTRQLLASSGIKVQPGLSSGRQIQAKADAYVRKHKLKKATGSEFTPNVEASYGKLRAALWNDDTNTASRMLDRLAGTHTKKEIEKAMDNWSERGFAGSKDNESKFKASLTRRELDLYEKAMEEKKEIRRKFRDLMVKR